LVFLKYLIQHCLICRPSDFTVSEDAGIEPKAVLRLRLWQSDALTTWLGVAINPNRFTYVGTYFVTHKPDNVYTDGDTVGPLRRFCE
jgi:hypothetical protein